MDTDFEERYQTGNIPWDHGVPDYNLVDFIKTRPFGKGAALDIGCGTGDNAIWLAQQGFEVTGYDLSQTAIRRAEEKAVHAGVRCLFRIVDYLDDAVETVPFSFIFDRGCFHCMSAGEERRAFVRHAADDLVDGGIWLSICGNADEPEREVGPPQLTAAELTEVVEPCFEILSLQSGYFGSDQENPPRAWICLMQKRRSP